MSSGMRRALTAAGILTLLLFAGRWTAATLADRWWGLAISPSAGQFLTDINLLQLMLDLAGVIVAAAWFTGNLLVVYRAIGTVEVSRQIANLEVREALTNRSLLAGTVILGVLLGLILGGDASRHWSTVALAWEGVQFNITEPVLGHDTGLYVAQLPLWLLAHAFATALVVAGVGTVLLLYAIIGSIRWIDGRPAISDHARRHLGWLLAAVALVLAWGLLLQPYVLVSGVAGEAGMREFQLVSLTSPALAGAALMVAVVSLVWALRARHFLLLAAWVVLGIGWFLGRVAGSALATAGDVPLGDMASRRVLDDAAYQLTALQDSTAIGSISPGTPPSWPSLWQTEPLVRIGDADSLLTAAADPSWIATPAGRRPAWLLLVSNRDSVATLRAVADDRISVTGGPLYYRPEDSLPSPTPAVLLQLTERAHYPGTAPVVIRDGMRGVPLDGLVRQVALGWALQEGGVLLGPGGGRTVDWARSPLARLTKLAPFADWSTPVPRYDGGRLYWVADGYVTDRHFPLTARVNHDGQRVGLLHASFVGMVEAESGEAHVYARPNPGPVGDAWIALAQGVVEPWTALPDGIRALLPYPAELFTAQARVLSPGTEATLVGRADSLRQTPPVSSFYWTSTLADAPNRTAEYVNPSTGQLQALLVGSSQGGRIHLTRVTIDSTVGLPGSELLEQRWERFPMFVQVLDSVRAGGGVLGAGGVRYWITTDAIGATQVRYGPRGGGGASVTWVSLASGSRLGAARSFPAAWTNLRGATVPAPPGAPGGTLVDARRWFRTADSAFRRGDFTAFGRAFEELRAVLELPPTPVR